MKIKTLQHTIVDRNYLHSALAELVRDHCRIEDVVCAQPLDKYIISFTF
jgi:hypothetical protein